MQADSADDLKEFRETLLTWWDGNARTFPWRRPENQSPYRTAVAEIMLRRTRADQVVPVYERFLALYPDLESAARANPDDIRQVLYPLGLAWRAENMVTFLRHAYATSGDDLPLDPGALRALPGVGDYVGSAIACFAGGQCAVLIDTNVVRVLGRIFGLDTTGEARRRRDMRELAARAVDMEKPAKYHYALLDFAALICVARKPRCQDCPFSRGEHCEYYRQKVRYQ